VKKLNLNMAIERGRDKSEERERQSRPGSKLCISNKYHCQLVVVLLTPG
jgi:hypothetical protein